MKLRSLLLLALVPCALFAADAAVPAPAAPIRVLLVDGYSNHDWKLTTALIRGFLEPTGLFKVTVATAPPTKEAPGWDTWRPKFADYDVVIQTCNDLGGKPAWPRAVQEDFEAYVRNGGGVYVWHAGNNAFPDWPAYNEMIGLGWRKKDFGEALAVDAEGKVVRIPTGAGLDTGHGARVDTVVKRLGDHPIHAGLPRAWLTPDIEVYYYARGPAKDLTVLSYGLDPKTQMNWPLEWTVAYGAGRVYTSTFGHVWKGDTQPARMRCAGVQTVAIRALQWLAKRDVTYPVPADFPTADKASVRAEIALPVAHRFLCTDSAGNTVSVVEADGRVSWRYKAQHPQDCWVLPNGNFLFCHARGALELTPDQAVAWEYKSPDGTEVHACQPLPDGRVLLVECGTARLIEVDRAGNIAKEIKLPMPPPNVKRHDQFRGVRKTAAGHYLVSAKGEHLVLELDGDGTLLRKIPVPGDVHEVLLLPDGHLLISCGDGHRIIELDEHEKIVWSLDENEVPGHPLRLMAGFQRLPNGNTIFCNYLGHGHLGQQPHAFEITRDKKVVWSFADHAQFKTVNQIQVFDAPGDPAKGEILR